METQTVVHIEDVTKATLREATESFARFYRADQAMKKWGGGFAEALHSHATTLFIEAKENPKRAAALFKDALEKEINYITSEEAGDLRLEESVASLTGKGAYARAFKKIHGAMMNGGNLIHDFRITQMYVVNADDESVIIQLPEPLDVPALDSASKCERFNKAYNEVRQQMQERQAALDAGLDPDANKPQGVPGGAKEERNIPQDAFQDLADELAQLARDCVDSGEGAQVLLDMLEADLRKMKKHYDGVLARMARQSGVLEGGTENVA